MWRLIKVLFFLIILGFIALVGYAYLGDMSPQIKQVNQPVTLDAE